MFGDIDVLRVQASLVLSGAPGFELEFLVVRCRLCNSGRSTAAGILYSHRALQQEAPEMFVPLSVLGGVCLLPP